MSEDRKDIFVNRSKEVRARQVVENPNQFDAESVERKSLEVAQKEGVKGEELIVAIYKRIGGALKDEPVKKEEKTGVISEETSGKEVEEIPAPGTSGRSRRSK